MKANPIATVATATAIFALLGLSACSKAPAPVPAEVLASELKLTNNHLFQIGHSNYFTGLMIEKYHDGQLKSRSSVSNGVLWGLSEGWHTNGELQVREQFRAGLSEGMRTKWETNGAKISETPIVGGRLNGVFRRWHPNGKLAEEIEMKHDQPNGLARAWHSSGSLKAEMQMVEGNIVEQKRWSDGEIPATRLASAVASK